MIDFKAIGKKISDHLTQQRAVSGKKEKRDEVNCLYRGPKGTSCAVGCLIQDEDYRYGMEGMGVYSLVGQYWLPLRHSLVSQGLIDEEVDQYSEPLLSYLKMWQGYHDGEIYRGWIDGVEDCQSPEAFYDLTLGNYV